MFKRLVIITVIVLSVLLFTKHSGIHISFKHQHKTLAQQLELTSQQISIENSLRNETHKELEPVIKQLEIEQKKYNKLVKRKASSKKLIFQKKVIDKLVVKYNEIHTHHLKHFEQMLNNEQKAKFTQIKARLFLSDSENI